MNFTDLSSRPRGDRAVVMPPDDTARADTAERLLAGVMERMEPHAVKALCNLNTGLASWWADWQVKHDRVRRIADLVARRDRERTALDETERELGAIASASPVS